MRVNKREWKSLSHQTESILLGGHRKGYYSNSAVTLQEGDRRQADLFQVQVTAAGFIANCKRETGSEKGVFQTESSLKHKLDHLRASSNSRGQAFKEENVWYPPGKQLLIKNVLQCFFKLLNSSRFLPGFFWGVLFAFQICQILDKLKTVRLELRDGRSPVFRVSLLETLGQREFDEPKAGRLLSSP